MINKTTNIYTEWLPLIEVLPDSEAGEIFKSILKYQNGDTVECKHPIWNFIRSKIDEYNSKYDDIVESRSKAGKASALARANKRQHVLTSVNKCQQIQQQNKTKQNKTIEKENIKRKRFNKPTLEEVKSYCLDRKNSVDYEKFVDHYEANGWKVGRNSMKDWKAAVRTWEKTSPENKKQEPKKDFTEENKKLVNSISNSTLEYVDCWSALNRLKNDPFSTVDKRSKAEIAIRTSKTKQLSESHLNLIEGILTEYCKK